MRVKKYFLLAAMIISLPVVCSCSVPVEEETVSASEVPLEPYEETEEEISYEYLEQFPLVTDHAYIAVYALQGSDAGMSSPECAGYGISLKVNLLDSSEETEPETVMEEERTAIIADTAPADIQASDLVEGTGTMIQELSWQETSDNTIYPCAAYIKVDDLGDGNYLSMVITVDNRQTDENSADVLSELFDAYGIALEDG